MIEKVELLKLKLENYKLIERQKKKGEIVLKGYPFWLTIDPSNICNLKCPFCPTGQRRGTRKPRLLKFEEFKKIIDILGKYLIHIDLCNWGEPLMNNEIYDMILYAKKFFIDIKLDTNVTLIDEDKAIKLVNSGIDKVILSIDGASKETYPVYRVGGDFKKVIKNVKILVEAKKQLKKDKPFLEWQFLVFKHNEDEIEKAKKLAFVLGVDMISFGTPYCQDIDWVSTKKEFSGKYYEIDNKEVKFKKTNNLCNWLWDAITINSDTSISPCCSVEDSKDDFFLKFPESNFLEKVWNSEKYIEARKHILKENRNVIKNSSNVCLRCDHIGLSNHMDVEFLVKRIENV